jgi:hypothetical protein
MNKNFFRVLAGPAMGIVFLTFLLFLLKRTNLLYTAYAWSIFAIIAFTVSFGFWVAGSKIRYILHATFPMTVIMYLGWTIAIAAIAVISEMIGASIHCGWFSLIEFAVLIIFSWKILALAAGREAIVNTEQNIKLQIISWKLIATDLAAIANRASVNDKPVIQRIADAARYADPTEHPGVNNEVNSIKNCISSLNEAVATGNSTDISTICTNIDRLIQERAAKLLILN